MASLNSISNVILPNAFLQIASSNSRLVCVFLGGKGGKVLYTLSTTGSAGVERRSTLFPVCRSIFTVVGRSSLFPSCRSISTSSSSNSSSSSSRSMVSLPDPSVSDHPFSLEISDYGLELSRIIGSDLLSPVFSTSAGFSAWLISIVLRMRHFQLLCNTALTWHFGFASVRPGRRPVSLLMAVTFSAT